MSNIEDTIKARSAVAASTNREMWTAAIAEWLFDAGAALANYDRGTVTLQYELRKATPDHPRERVILTGDVSPRIQISRIVEKTKPI